MCMLCVCGGRYEWEGVGAYVGVTSILLASAKVQSPHS